MPIDKNIIPRPAMTWKIYLIAAVVAVILLFLVKALFVWKMNRTAVASTASAAPWQMSNRHPPALAQK